MLSSTRSIRTCLVVLVTLAAGVFAQTGDIELRPVGGLDNSSVVVGSSQNPSATGQLVTFTATVSAVPPAVGTPTGTVTFFRNGSPICSNRALNASGQATCQITFTLAGNYNITAAYSGSATFNPSTSPTLVQQVLGTTAANVSVSGRVWTADGRGVSKARVTITDSEGNTLYALSNGFGYFRFIDVPAGQGYVVDVKSKRYSFTPRLLTISDNITDLDLVAEP